MKGILSLIFLLLPFTAYLSAQVSPPPPPISRSKQNTPPRPALVKKWDSKEGGFKVRFPSTPTVSVKETESAFGKTTFTSIVFSNAFATYIVAYLDFPTVTTDKYELDIRLDAVRNKISEINSARIVEDAEFLFGSYYGRSNVFETEKVTISMRNFFVGPRFFNLSVITHGRQSTLQGRIASSNKTRIDGFFNSFEITKVPEPVTDIVLLPEDFKVKITETLFSSSLLGVSFSPPAKWVHADLESSEFIKELSKDSLKEIDPRLSARFTDEHIRFLAMFTKTDLAEGIPEAFFFVLVEQASFPNFLPLYAGNTFQKLYLGRDDELIQTSTLTKVGGRDFAWLETQDTETDIYRRLYIGNIKGMSFELIFIYKKKEDLDELLKVLETVRFTET